MPINFFTPINFLPGCILSISQALSINVAATTQCCFIIIPQNRQGKVKNFPKGIQLPCSEPEFEQLWNDVPET